MSVRRLVSASIVVGVVALVGITGDAQFSNPLKKIPKPPSVPGVKTPPVPGTSQPSTPASTPASKEFDPSRITDAFIDRFLKAQEVKKKVHDEELAKANTKKAEADALAKTRAEGTVSEMMRVSDCKDAFKEKDKRSSEIARLERLVEAADSRGDEAKSEALRKQLDPLNAAIDLDADRACGGKGTAALHDCLEKKKAQLAKQGVTEPMLSVQAQGECKEDPATSGAAGATAASVEENAANSAAADAMANADAKADQAEKEATGLDDKERGMFIDIVVGVLEGEPATLATTPAGAKAAIQNRSAELKKAAR